MIKLLALDIDGTILKQDYTLSENVKKAIEQTSKKGVKVVLVTGRMHKATTFIAKELGLDTPIITYNGALARSEEKTFFAHLIEKDLVTKIVQETKKFDAQINLYVDDELYSEKETPALIEYCEKRKIDYHIESFDNMEEIKANKLLLIGKGPVQTTQIIHHMQAAFTNELNAVRSMPTFCEILDKKASKGNAINYLANYWNISQEEIMAAGDQDNDIELLKAAHIKVAMGNSTEGLRKIANYIAPSVDEDGLAIAIQELILDKN